MFILYAGTLSCGLRATIQGAELEPYWPAPEVMILLHLLFVDDHLLIS